MPSGASRFPSFLPVSSAAFAIALLGISGCGDAPTPPAGLDGVDPPEAPLLSIGGGDCPEGFAFHCGPDVQCSTIDPFSAEGLEILSNVAQHSGSHQWECDVGMWGVELAMNQDRVFWAEDWGTCIVDNPYGMHDYVTEGGTILLDPSLSTVETTKTAWHEGWSWYRECTDFDCHDHSFLGPAEDACYPTY